MKALVAVEPAGPPFVDHPALGSFTFGLTPVPLGFGPGGPGEVRRRAGRGGVGGVLRVRAVLPPTAEYLRSCGAAVDEIRLGDLGIHGNRHAMMLEKNNAEVAAVITDWIVKHT